MPTTAKPAGTVCSGINGVSYAPPSTVLSVFAKGRGSAKTASRPFRFRKSAPIPEKRRPSLLRNRPSCLPVRQGSRRRSRSGASPFDAHKKGGAPPPLIGGCRKDKLKKRPRIRKTTRVYAVICSPQQRFLCAGMMRAAVRPRAGFRRGDIRLMHTARTVGAA